MNIIWNIETSLEVTGASNKVNVRPHDLWEDVKLSGTSLRLLRRNQTVDITRNNVVCKNIPVNWYLIEN